MNLEISGNIEIWQTVEQAPIDVIRVCGVAGSPRTIGLQHGIYGLPVSRGGQQIPAKWVAENFKTFLRHASMHPENKYLVDENLGSLKPEELKSVLGDFKPLKNVFLPPSFLGRKNSTFGVSH